VAGFNTNVAQRHDILSFNENIQSTMLSFNKVIIIVDAIWSLTNTISSFVYSF